MKRQQAAAMEEKMTQMMAAMAAATPAPAAVAEKAEDFDGHYISGDDWSKLMDRITKLENKVESVQRELVGERKARKEMEEKMNRSDDAWKKAKLAATKQ